MPAATALRITQAGVETMLTHLQSRADEATCRTPTGRVVPAGPGTEYFDADQQYDTAVGFAVGELIGQELERQAAVPADPVQVQWWLFGIARHVVADARRGSVRHQSLADRLRATLAVTATAPAADAGVEVRDAIDRLEPGSAELVRLVHWEGFSLAEASRVLGIPASTGCGRYQRAKHLVRTALRTEPTNAT